MIISIWLTAVALQIVITILLTFQFLRFKPGHKTNAVSFSVVIAAHNEEKNLSVLLPKLLAQQHENFEVIVALDRCDDASLEVVRRFDSIKMIDIEAVPQGFDPKKNALTLAASHSKGEWLAFLDADCLPNSRAWLTGIEKEIQEEVDILIGYSPYQNHGSLLSSFIQFEAFVTAFNYLAMALMGRPYMSVGRNMAIRKSFFDKVDGYANFKSVTGGDDDLFIQKNSTKANTKVFMGKEGLNLTEPKRTWKEYFRQKTRHLSAGSSYSPVDQWLHMAFNGSLFLIWLLIPFVSIEIIMPIILFYLSVKVIGYRFAESKMGAGFNYIVLPLVDLMYAMILPIIAIRSKLVKDIRWKN